MGRADELGEGHRGENPIAVLLIRPVPGGRRFGSGVIDALWMSAASCLCLLFPASACRWCHVGSEVSKRQRPPNATGYGVPAERGTRLRRPRRNAYPRTATAGGAPVLSSCLTACFEM